MLIHVYFVTGMIFGILNSSHRHRASLSSTSVLFDIFPYVPLRSDSGMSQIWICSKYSFPEKANSILWLKKLIYQLQKENKILNSALSPNVFLFYIYFASEWRWWSSVWRPGKFQFAVSCKAYLCTSLLFPYC